MILQLSMIVIAFGLAMYSLRCMYLLRKIKKQVQQLKETNEKLQIDLTRTQEKILQDVLTDPLTQLPSRKIFEDRLKLAVNQSMRHQLILSVMCLELDGLKTINNALGYEMGDEVIKEMARRLQECIRQVDTVSRLNGNQFAFIFTQLTKAEMAAYIAKRLLNAISEPFIIQEKELYLTARLGIAIFPIDGKDEKILLKNADSALQQASSHSYQFYRQEMDELSKRELALSSSLCNPAIFEEFTVLYQPRVDVKNKRIECMEVILNWQSKGWDLITCEEILHLAEKNNTIISLSEWLLKKVCHDVVTWQQQGFCPRLISLPLSVKQLENLHFIQKISSIFSEMNLSPSSFVFEITGYTLFPRIDLIEKMLNRMKRVGVQIAINNLGLGHLELQYLRRLPITIFKIDHSLVSDVTNNPESVVIIKMIMALSKNLQATVVADGVEIVEQKQALLDMGCVVMQGRYFGSPLAASQFTEKVLQDMSGV